jgi:acyl-CoA hydrolase
VRFVLSVVNTPWESRAASASDAVASLASGMRIFVHGAAATPTVLPEALTARVDLARAWRRARVDRAPDFRAELRRDLAAIRHMPVSLGLSAFESATEPQVVQ